MNAQHEHNPRMNNLRLLERISIRIGVAAGAISVLITLIASDFSECLQTHARDSQQRRHPVLKLQHCIIRSCPNGL